MAGVKAGPTQHLASDGSAFIPSREHLFLLEPAWRNCTDNHLAVQLVHRMGHHAPVVLAACSSMPPTARITGVAAPVQLLWHSCSCSSSARRSTLLLHAAD